MSKIIGMKSLRAIEEYEEKRWPEIWQESNNLERELGYIVYDNGWVIKQIGYKRILRPEELEFYCENSADWHTHEFSNKAELSSKDVSFTLAELFIRGVDGMGIIAKDECKYWEIIKPITAELYKEYKEIEKEWDNAFEKIQDIKRLPYPERTYTENIKELRRYAKITDLCRGRIASLTKRMRKEGLVLVYSEGIK